jgi:hypothetical protein
MAQYVLPCQCGRSLEVGTGQAGRTVRCECGTELEVPSIRGLEHLQRATPEQVESKWGARQGVLFVGLLLMALGFGAGIFFQLRRPKLDDYATIRAEVDAWPVEQQRMYWEYVEKFGIRLSTPEDFQIVEDDKRFGTWSLASFLMAGVGLALAAGSLLFLGKKTSDETTTAPMMARRKGRRPT